MDKANSGEGKSCESCGRDKICNTRKTHTCGDYQPKTKESGEIPQITAWADGSYLTINVVGHAPYFVEDLGADGFSNKEIAEIAKRINTDVEKVEYCNWGYDSEGVHETSCGQMFQLNDGTLKDNKMKYCCYCGKEIKEYDTDEDIKRLSSEGSK